MKGSKLKVKNCPSFMGYVLCRFFAEGQKITPRIDKKLRKSLGINFNKTAIKMQKLGFCPDTAKEDWSIVFKDKE